MTKQLCLIGFLAILLTAHHPALALTTETGTAVPDSRANLADPDEKMPVLLGGGQAANTDQLGEDYAGNGFVNKDAVAQSAARGSGAYIQPDPRQ